MAKKNNRKNQISKHEYILRRENALKEQLAVRRVKLQKRREKRNVNESSNDAMMDTDFENRNAPIAQCCKSKKALRRMGESFVSLYVYRYSFWTSRKRN